MEQIFSYSEIPREEYVEFSNACPGCGPLLGLRTVLKIVRMHFKDIFVIANGFCAKQILPNTFPSMCVEKFGKIPSEEKKLIAFDQNGDLEELKKFVNKNDNFLLISYSDESVPLARIMNCLGIEYSATASIAYPLDFVNKVIKAMKYDKSFIHLHAPCPTKWDFDPSNTIEVSKLAISSGYFPLYEIKEKEFLLTFRPRILERVKSYFEIRGIKKNEEEIDLEQQRINRNWKLLEAGKFWMVK